MKITRYLAVVSQELNRASWLSGEPTKASKRGQPRQTFRPKDHLPQQQTA